MLKLRLLCSLFSVSQKALLFVRLVMKSSVPVLNLLNIRRIIRFSMLVILMMLLGLFFRLRKLNKFRLHWITLRFNSGGVYNPPFSFGASWNGSLLIGIASLVLSMPLGFSS